MHRMEGKFNFELYLIKSTKSTMYVEVGDTNYQLINKGMYLTIYMVMCLLASTGIKCCIEDIRRK